MPDEAARQVRDAGRPSGRCAGEFELLETLRWSPRDGFFLLERHLRRLERSARFFDYPCSSADVRRALESSVADVRDESRLRLLVGRGGGIRVERAPLEPSPDPVRVAFALAPIDPTDVFLFHKTTNRGQYDRAQLPGFDDVVLWNPAGQVTETTIANIVAELGGRKVTPPVDCGLLAGTFREELLERGAIVEAPLRIADLHRASAVWLINSVRKWRRARILGASPSR